MFWLPKNDHPKVEVETEHAHDNRVEVVVHKTANKEAAQDAKEANEKLNQLLAANGFTLKIYLATGGQVKQKETH